MQAMLVIKQSSEQIQGTNYSKILTVVGGSMIRSVLKGTGVEVRLDITLGVL